MDLKVYIASTGCYDNYEINSIFSSRKTAEEYVKWLEHSNEVEEYELDEKINCKKYYKIVISVRSHNNGSGDLEYQQYKTTNNAIVKKGFLFLDAHRYNKDYFDLRFHEFVEAQNYIEHVTEQYYKKYVNNVLNTVKEKIKEGYNEAEIKDFLDTLNAVVCDDDIQCN